MVETNKAQAPIGNKELIIFILVDERSNMERVNLPDSI